MSEADDRLSRAPIYSFLAELDDFFGRLREFIYANCYNAVIVPSYYEQHVILQLILKQRSATQRVGTKSYLTTQTLFWQQFQFVITTRFEIVAKKAFA